MVTATVDNNPVSVGLNNEESVTIPTGEVWKLHVCLPNNGYAYINGYYAFQNSHGDISDWEVVLTGGDTIKSKNGEMYLCGLQIK